MEYEHNRRNRDEHQTTQPSHQSEPSTVVSDATAAAQVEEGDGYAAALVNFRYIANTVWTTGEAVKAMQAK